MLKKYLDSENIMSTNTILSGGKSLVQRTVDSLVDFKDRYCPDGQQCNDIATIGSLIGMVVFMYIAMAPIIHW